MGDDGNRELADALGAVLGATSIVAPVRLSGGASRETFRFQADGRPLVLQRQRRGAVHDMAVEAAVLRLARLAGVPVPEVIAASTDASALGASFMILSAVDGETIARKILRDDEFAEARQRLTGQLGAATAALHAAPVGDLTVAVPAGDPLTEYRAVLDAQGEPHPAFELAFAWLLANRPAAQRRSLVHGDLRLGNLIVGPDGLRAVIDWELVHLGDPMEDLGWLCAKAWRFGGRLPVAGVGRYDELFSAYEHASGLAVDPAAVHWWEVFATLKWGIICIGQAAVHTAGLSRSHELAAIGRRVCETEHDLFLALEGHW